MAGLANTRSWAGRRQRIVALRRAVRVVPTLGILLVAGLALRLALSPIGGFETDQIAMQIWAGRLVTHPVASFYSEGFADHLPGDLWILWLLGRIYHLVSPDSTQPLPVVMLKTIPALADTAAAGLLYLISRRFAGPAAGLLAAALLVFSPGPIFLAGIWGQWDALSSAVALLALWFYLRDRPEWALPALTYAALVKPPLAALIPFFLLATLRRYILPLTPLGARLAPESERLESPRQTARRAAIAIGASILVVLVVLLPFDVGVPPMPTEWSIFERFRFALDVYPLTTVNTFTIWWPLADNWQPDNQTFLGIAYQRWGTLLMVSAYAVILWRFWRWQGRDAARSLVWACLATPLALFVLPTRGHERYLYPAVMIAALVAAIAPRLRWLAVALALTYFANIYFVYDLYYDVPAPKFFHFPVFANAVSIFNAFLLLYVLVRGLPLLASDGEPALAPAGVPPQRAAFRVAPVMATRAALGARVADGRQLLGRAGRLPLVTRGRALAIARSRVDAGTLPMLIPLGLFLAALAIRAPNLTAQKKVYFDEVYFVTTSGQYAVGNADAHFFYVNAPYGSAYEWTHPPTGKLIQATSILLAGDRPLGWRLAETVAGAMTVVVVYLLALNVTGNLGVAALTGGLMLSDGLLLAMSRIGTVDAFVVLFTASALLAFHGVLSAAPERVAWPLLRTGALLGLGISTKWNATYGAGVIGLVTIGRVLQIAWRWWRRRRTAEGPAAWAGLRAHLFWVPVAMLLVPAAIYLLAYVPFFITGPGRSWGDFLRLQQSMFEYHSGVVPSHPYRSTWWEWPLALGRMWFYSDRSNGVVRSIYVNVNPALSLCFIPAVAWVAWHWRRGHGAALTTLLVGFFGQWLIWAVSPRSEAFIYHFLPMVPFGCLAVAVVLNHLWRGNTAQRTAAAALLTTIVVVFIFYYPLITAMPMTEAQTSARTWFDDWWRHQWSA